MPTRDELAENTVAELRQIAKDRDIEGRSGMDKQELIDAIASFEESRVQNEPAPQPAPARVGQAEVGDQRNPVRLGHDEEDGVARVSFPVEGDLVPRAEYERLLNENQQLRQALQTQLQGPVGAPASASPTAGENF